MKQISYIIYDVDHLSIAPGPPTSERGSDRWQHGGAYQTTHNQAPSYLPNTSGGAH